MVSTSTIPKNAFGNVRERFVSVIIRDFFVFTCTVGI